MSNIQIVYPLLRFEMNFDKIYFMHAWRNFVADFRFNVPTYAKKIDLLAFHFVVELSDEETEYIIIQQKSIPN